MKSLKNFLNTKLTNQEIVTIKGGGGDKGSGIFCEWYVGRTKKP